MIFPRPLQLRYSLYMSHKLMEVKYCITQLLIRNIPTTFSSAGRRAESRPVLVHNGYVVCMSVCMYIYFAFLTAQNLSFPKSATIICII